MSRLSVLQNKASPLNTCRVDIAEVFRRNVLGPVLVLSYLPTISPFLPDCAATQRIWLQMEDPDRPFVGSFENWRDGNWQQVCSRIMKGCGRAR